MTAWTRRRTKHHFPLTTSERLFASVLRLFPRSFRERHGQDMIEAFRDQRRERRSHHSPLVRFRFLLAEFGDVLASAVRERARQSQQSTPSRRRISMFESVSQDIRFALRAIVRQPIFSIVIVLTLALGVGANTAIFSVVNGTLLEPLPFEHSERIVTVWEDFTAQGGPAQEWIEVPNFFEWRKSGVFDTLSAYGFGSASALIGNEPRRLASANVSHDFFAGFGIEPVLGRVFSEEEDRPGADPLVLISHRLWQSAFEGSEGVIGRPLNINGRPATIVGVLPAGFETPLAGPIDLWAPVNISPTSHTRNNFFLQGIGRLKAGVSVSEAEAALNAIMEEIGRQFPENEGVEVSLVPLLDQLVMPIRTGLWLVLGVVSVVLLIACANIANLILSRSAARHQEMAVRIAVGAGRGRLVRQLLTESTVLSLLGGLAGLAVGYWGLQWLLSLAPAEMPRLSEISLNGPVLVFALVVTLLSAVVFGLAPALQGSRTDINSAFSELGRESREAPSGGRLRRLLVVSEVALVFTLLVACGLLVQSFASLQRVDPGFVSDQVVTGTVLLTRDRYPDRTRLIQFMDEAIQKLSAQPGIDSVAAVSVLPLSGGDSDTSFAIEGRPAPSRPQDTPTIWYRRVTQGYFETLGIPLLRGREFTASDHAQAPPVVMINEVAAERFWPNQEAVGKRVRFGDGTWHSIVGVVRGVRYRNLAQEPPSELYFPYSQRPGRFMNVVAKSSLGTESVAGAMKAGLSAVDPSLPLATIARLEDIVAASLSVQRFVTLLITAFAVLALVLSTIGIYGVISYSVSRRTYEMGLRMALGAHRQDVLSMVVRHGMTLTGIGIILGLGLSLWGTRSLAPLLFTISPTDVRTFAGMALFLALVGLIACLIPAYRATRIDPLRALRCE